MIYAIAGHQRGGNERYNLVIGQPAQPALRTRAVPKKILWLQAALAITALFQVVRVVSQVPEP